MKKIDKVLGQDSNILILAGLVGDPITKKYKIVSFNKLHRYQKLDFKL